MIIEASDLSSLLSQSLYSASFSVETISTLFVYVPISLEPSQCKTTSYVALSPGFNNVSFNLSVTTTPSFISFQSLLSSSTNFNPFGI